MAAVSDALPSPGAPVTAGTRALRLPSLAMLPVVWFDVDASATFFLAAGLVATSLLGTPTPTGGGALSATAGPFALGSQATKDPVALAATAWATVGVIAAQGSAEGLAGAISSPAKRFTRLPLGSETSST